MAAHRCPEDPAQQHDVNSTPTNNNSSKPTARESLPNGGGDAAQFASLLKLRGISEDEKSENALLRSRIDEQSQLIMILKRRADEATETAKSLDRQNTILVEQNRQMSDDLSVHVRRCEMLESRFNDLASNHQQMIVFKDEYKRRNEELKAENDRLRSDNERLFSAAIVERDLRIAQLEKLHAEKADKLSRLEEQFRESQLSAAELQKRLNTELDASRSQLSSAEQNLRDVQSQLQQLKCSAAESNEKTQSELEKLTKDKEDLLELAMSRGRTIQDKQAENSRLQKRLEASEKTIKELNEKLVRESAVAAVDKEVLRLQNCLVEAHQVNESLTLEYETFKKHSQQLLQQEKQLNEKLRHLVS